MHSVTWAGEEREKFKERLQSLARCPIRRTSILRVLRNYSFRNPAISSHHITVAVLVLILEDTERARLACSHICFQRSNGSGVGGLLSQSG